MVLGSTAKPIALGRLSSRIGLATPGETVKLKGLARQGGDDGRRQARRRRRRRRSRSAAATRCSRGARLALRPLTSEERSASKIEQGLVIERAAGPSARARLTAGDVLPDDQWPAGVVGRADQKRARAQTKSVGLLVERQGSRVFVPVNLGWARARPPARRSSSLV